MNFQERLKYLQEKNNITKKSISDAIGISVRNYYRYERGEQNPTLPILILLADYFEVSIDYLVGRTDNPNINY